MPISSIIIYVYISAFAILAFFEVTFYTKRKLTNWVMGLAAEAIRQDKEKLSDDL